ncbi:hypothetical protein Dimus_015313 [Dionaea muscipula]
MKINKSKGKVHPSPSSILSPPPAPAPPSSSSSPAPPPAPTSTTTATKDAISALKLLPAAIFTLISILSLEDKEVLAYMITRSIKATANPFSLLEENKKQQQQQRNRTKKPAQAQAAHKLPLFDCGCFDCYTSYWIRWDSSPNRELIHQAIEAFEEHLATGEQSNRKAGGSRGKRRDRMGARRLSESQAASTAASSTEAEVLLAPMVTEPVQEGVTVAFEPLPEAPIATEAHEEEVEEKVVDLVEDLMVVEAPCSPEEEETVAVRSEGGCGGAGGNHKGLARKVLPDVMGLFNSRLWGLWNPNV